MSAADISAVTLEVAALLRALRTLTPDPQQALQQRPESQANKGLDRSRARAVVQSSPVVRSAIEQAIQRGDGRLAPLYLRVAQVVDPCAEYHDVDATLALMRDRLVTRVSMSGKCTLLLDHVLMGLGDAAHDCGRSIMPVNAYPDMAPLVYVYLTHQTLQDTNGQKLPSSLLWDMLDTLGDHAV